ncbi:8-oxo-dGTP diphosphatase MutT, partial [Salmonella enterica]
PWGKQGQPGRGSAQHALTTDDFPPGNEPIIRKLRQFAP